jgi:aminoglycoside phosphotransferase (APT) family kinase protein
MTAVDKSRPSPAWIESLRRRYPCEREVDNFLTRKMLRRAGPPYSPVSFDTMVAGLNALLKASLTDEYQVLDPQWMTGGASKLQMRFTLDWIAPGKGRTRTVMVLRMQPAESGLESSRLREFQINAALSGQLPVAPTYWIDAEGVYFPYPATVCGFVPGVSKPTAGNAGVAGTGTTFPPQVAAKLGLEFVQHMAALHRFKWQHAALGAFDAPTTPTQAAEWQINWWERVVEEDGNEDIPLLRLAIAWLRQNPPPADHLSIVHGDLKTGNFLYDEDSNKITAILDWETAHIGDRHEDLVYMTSALFFQPLPDGKTGLLGGLLPEEAFYEAYEKASGFRFVPQAAQYYKVLNSVKIIAVCMASCYRSARGGKGHQDVLTAWMIGVGYLALEDLRRLLEEII